MFKNKMKYSQMNLRSGLMERVKRKLEENQSIQPLDDSKFSIQSVPGTIPCSTIKPVKIQQRGRLQTQMGWHLR